MIKIQNNKKAMQHLEIIIAFMMFSSAIFFTLYFMKMPKQEKYEFSTLDLLQNNFEEYAKINLTKIIIRSENPEEFSIDLSNIRSNLDTNVNSLLFSENLNSINSIKYSLSKLSSNKIRIKVNSKGKYLFFIYLSEQFNSSELGSSLELPSNNYTIELFEKDKIISALKIKDIIEEYNSNYETLKNNLKIPEDFDFSININGDYAIIESKQPNKDSEVFAKTAYYPILNLVQDNFENLFSMEEVTLKIWKQ